MYYVIKRVPNTRPVEFIGFKVPKYISNKKSDTVIFEYTVDGKKIRKWVPKDEIILLTKNKDFFTKTITDFKKTQEEQQKILNQAQAHLEQTLDDFSNTMEEKLDQFEKICDEDDVPDILKDL